MMMQALRGFCLTAGYDVVEGEVFEVDAERAGILAVSGAAFIVPDAAAPSIPEPGHPGVYLPLGGKSSRYPPEPTTAADAVVAAVPAANAYYTASMGDGGGLSGGGWEDVYRRNAGTGQLLLGVSTVSGGSHVTGATRDGHAVTAVGTGIGSDGALSIAAFHEPNAATGTYLVTVDPGATSTAQAILEVSGTPDASVYATGTDASPTTPASELLTAQNELVVAFLVVSGDPFAAGSEPTVPEWAVLISTTTGDGGPGSPFTVYHYQWTTSAPQAVGFACTLASSRTWALAVVAFK